MNVDPQICGIGRQLTSSRPRIRLYCLSYRRGARGRNGAIRRAARDLWPRGRRAICCTPA